jgi:hypothetical protein
MFYKIYNEKQRVSKALSVHAARQTAAEYALILRHMHRLLSPIERPDRLESSRLYPGGKRPVSDYDNSSPYITEVKEAAAIYNPS